MVSSQPNPAAPQVVLVPTADLPQNINFSVSFVRVQEVTANGDVVRVVPLHYQNLSVVVEQQGGVTSWTYDQLLEDGTDITLQFAMVSSPTPIEFANQSYVLQPSSLKATISVAYWPFAGIKNQLQIISEIGAAHEEDNITCTTTKSNNDKSGTLVFALVALTHHFKRKFTLAAIQRGRSVNVWLHFAGCAS